MWTYTVHEDSDEIYQGTNVLDAIAAWVTGQAGQATYVELTAIDDDKA